MLTMTLDHNSKQTWTVSIKPEYQTKEKAGCRYFPRNQAFNKVSSIINSSNQMMWPGREGGRERERKGRENEKESERERKGRENEKESEREKKGRENEKESEEE